MNQMTLEYPRRDAKTILKAAFEVTDGIRSYTDTGERIVGKTGFRLSSYGERIIVHVPERQPDPDRTRVSISAEREVQVNVTADPGRFERRYVAAVTSLRGRPLEEVLEMLREREHPGRTKEVEKTEQFDRGETAGSMVTIVALCTLLFFVVILL